MARLYLEGSSLACLAKKFNTDFYVLKRALKAQGVGLRVWSPELTKAHIAEIVSLYVQDGLGMRKIESRFGIHRKTLRRLLVDNGVKIRAEVKPVLSDEDKNRVVALYQAGQHAREISKQFGCAATVVSRVLEERGIRKRTSQDRKVLADKADNYVHIPRTVLHRRANGATNSGVGWDISIDDVENAFARQRGLCYYTNLPMVWAATLKEYDLKVSKNPMALSIDRKDSGSDYTPDNIVLCCRFVNYAKNSYSEDQFKDLLAKTVQSLSPSLVPSLAPKPEAVTADFNPWEF